MITEERVRELKHGTNLYRVLAQVRKGKPIKYSCSKATVAKVTPMTVTFIANTPATSRGKRQTSFWVAENMALSRQGAWDHAAADMWEQCEQNKREIDRLTEAGMNLAVEHAVLKNKGKR